MAKIQFGNNFARLGAKNIFFRTMMVGEVLFPLRREIGLSLAINVHLIANHVVIPTKLKKCEIKIISK